MKQKLIRLVTGALMASVLVAACSPAATTIAPTAVPATSAPAATTAPATSGATAAATTVAGKGKVCEVTDTGGVDDKSFNALGWIGAQQAATDLGWESAYLESK